jgi:predicted ABC-type ATPase
MADTCEIIGLPIDVRYMLKVETLLPQISELNKAPIYDNAQLEKSLIEQVEHSWDMSSVAGEGYELLQQINNKLDY